MQNMLVTNIGALIILNLSLIILFFKKLSIVYENCLKNNHLSDKIT
jgi:hypothetical protein